MILGDMSEYVISENHQVGRVYAEQLIGGRWQELLKKRRSFEQESGALSRFH